MDTLLHIKDNGDWKQVKLTSPKLKHNHSKFTFTNDKISIVFDKLKLITVNNNYLYKPNEGVLELSVFGGLNINQIKMVLERVNLYNS